MIGRFLVRQGYWVAVVTLATASGLLAAFLAVNLVLPELERAGVIGATTTPGPSAVEPASPAPSQGIEMGGAIIPDQAQCIGCHQTEMNTGTLSVPVIAHPLEGWSKCTSCHAPKRLVDTAPGHSGIHATECTVCHRPGDLPAPLSRPHRTSENTACLSCHGTKAPLPTDMTHRKESTCWLCHRLPTVEPPVPAHETAPGEADCQTCHVAGGRAGALPADHVERPSDLCLACHDVRLATTSGAPPRVTIWPAPSTVPSPIGTAPAPIGP